MTTTVSLVGTVALSPGLQPLPMLASAVRGESFISVN